ncbi:DgyrCDS7015 [Dimorphilus gyrociliatus]|uniref:DgyrCDS7015 n=1 Tax=Dimorphilus gyrociliatus TaxID=2664684 RepID=A0A7I8VPT7_9ANNE|nr:DgyrCDS7015 [Dimorphilus gyrociliatus]
MATVKSPINEMEYGDFLRKLKTNKYAYLYGGISKNGLPILVIPDNKQIINRNEFKYLLKFMTTTLKYSFENCNVETFTIVLDRRNSKWAHVREFIKESIITNSELINMVLIIKPIGFFQKLSNSNLERSNAINIHKLDNTDQLQKFICKENLTIEYKGNIKYDFYIWIDCLKFMNKIRLEISEIEEEIKNYQQFVLKWLNLINPDFIEKGLNDFEQFIERIKMKYEKLDGNSINFVKNIQKSKDNPPYLSIISNHIDSYNAKIREDNKQFLNICDTNRKSLQNNLQRQKWIILYEQVVVLIKDFEQLQVDDLNIEEEYNSIKDKYKECISQIEHCENESKKLEEKSTKHENLQELRSRVIAQHSTYSKRYEQTVQVKLCLASAEPLEKSFAAFLKTVPELLTKDTKGLCRILQDVESLIGRRDKFCQEHSKVLESNDLTVDSGLISKLEDFKKILRKYYAELGQVKMDIGNLINHAKIEAEWKVNRHSNDGKRKRDKKDKIRNLLPSTIELIPRELHLKEFDEFGNKLTTLQKSITELIESEKKYVAELQTVKKRYIENIQTQLRSVPKELINNKYNIFSNWEELLEFHETKVLKVFEENSLNLSNLAFHLYNIASNFGIYQRYCRNYVKNRELIEKMEDHEFFTDFCRNRYGPTQMEFVMSGGKLKSLSAYLCSPFSRFGQYVTNFERILNNMPKDSEEFEAMKLAVRTLSDEVSLINDSDCVNDVVEVTKKVSLPFSKRRENIGEVRDILLFSKCLIKPRLFKIHQKETNSKQPDVVHKTYRTVFLFHNALIFASRPDDRKYRFKGSIKFNEDLLTCFLNLGPHGNPATFVFQLQYGRELEIDCERDSYIFEKWAYSLEKVVPSDKLIMPPNYLTLPVIADSERRQTEKFFRNVTSPSQYSSLSSGYSSEISPSTII